MFNALVLFFVFFFFKQKTAYEMRISDWSSDVCSSDLIYRERVSLASGRFAMIDDGLGFQLVPWRPALDRHLGQHVAGTMAAGGSIDWSLGRGRGIGIG